MLIIWIRAVSLYKQHIHTHSFLNSERMKFAKSLSFSLLAKKEFTAGSIHSFFLYTHGPPCHTQLDYNYEVIMFLCFSSVHYGYGK